jgi:diguanylate cyclase (GGDEF)-like protein/PAS domain S-box-containing protein
MESRELYHLLFENSNSIMLLINPDTGDILDANRVAASYYGYTKDALLSMRIHDINILSQDQINEEMSLAKAEKRSYFDFVHRLASGECREVEVHSAPICTESGKLLFSIIHDASDKRYQKLMYDTLFFYSPYAVAVLDSEQNVIKINKNFTGLFHYTEEELVGKSLSSIVASVENMNQIDQNVKMIYEGLVVKQEGKRKRKDGKLIEVEILCYPVLHHHEIIGVYIIYIDISKRIEYEEQLLLFKQILKNNTEGVVITDSLGNITWINNAFRAITGYLPGEAIGKTMALLKSGVQSQTYYHDMWKQLLEYGFWQGEICNKRKNGDLYSEWLTIKSIRSNSSTSEHYVGIFKDLSEKQRIDRRMIELQQRDSLTGLYNRNYCINRMDTLIEQSKTDHASFAVLYLNISGLKDINNSLGHHYGDELLIELSRRLLLQIDSDDLLYRFSDDVFIILYPNCSNRTELDIFIGSTLEKVRKPYMIDNSILYISASIGICCYPEHGKNSGILIQHADIAMNKAKNLSGENVCYYSCEMSEEYERKFTIANYLTRAVSNQEFHLCYQPIYCLSRKNTLVGAEALLRWSNPALGDIGPDEFISLAERTGHILIIGEWVLEQVCRSIWLWQRKSYPSVPISVNISVKQLEQNDFCQKVIRTLKKYELEASCIELEITESVSSGDVITIVNNLSGLKKAGIKISMDDFGTGFSSLGQIERFELDKLKIDKVFIRDIVSTLRKQNLVKSIIAMAKGLDLTVVAEGIETTEQLNYLKEYGCHMGQGYLLSRPLLQKDFERILQGDDTGLS